MVSASRTDEMRWAMRMIVMRGLKVRREVLIWASVEISTAEVASSRMSMRGLRRSARAMQMRCFCPPEKVTPLCATEAFVGGGVGGVERDVERHSAVMPAVFGAVRRDAFVPRRARHFERPAFARRRAAAHADPDVHCDDDLGRI